MVKLRFDHVTDITVNFPFYDGKNGPPDVVVNYNHRSDKHALYRMAMQCRRATNDSPNDNME